MRKKNIISYIWKEILLCGVTVCFTLFYLVVEYWSGDDER